MASSVYSPSYRSVNVVLCILLLVPRHCYRVHNEYVAKDLISVTNTNERTGFRRPHARARAHTHTHTRARARARTHAHARTHMHTHAHTHARTHARTSTHRHTHRHTHAHTHIHTHTKNTHTHARLEPILIINTMLRIYFMSLCLHQFLSQRKGRSESNGQVITANYF